MTYTFGILSELKTAPNLPPEFSKINFILDMASRAGRPIEIEKTVLAPWLEVLMLELVWRSTLINPYARESELVRRMIIIGKNLYMKM